MIAGAVEQIGRIVEARIPLLGLADKLPLVASQDAEGCRTLVCSCPPGTGHQSGTTSNHCLTNVDLPLHALRCRGGAELSWVTHPKITCPG
jgi:hypothetical protein